MAGRSTVSSKTIAREHRRVARKQIDGVRQRFLTQQKVKCCLQFEKSLYIYHIHLKLSMAAFERALTKQGGASREHGGACRKKPVLASRIYQEGRSTDRKKNFNLNL
jgi:hypothetical protein